MTEKSTFQETRVKNRKAYLEERKSQEAKYLKHVSKVGERCENLTSSLDNFLRNEIGTWDILEMQGHMLQLQLLKGTTIEDVSDQVKEKVKGKLDSATRKYLEDFGLDVEREYFIRKKRTLKKMHKERIARIKINYGACISDIQNSLGDITNFLQNGKYKMSGDSESSLLNVIGKLNALFCSEGKKEVDVNKIEELKQEFLKESVEYKYALKTYKPKFEGDIKAIARANLRCLEEEISTKKTKKNEYLDSLEGLALGYCVYELEAKRVGNWDRDYTEFLRIKSAEKLLKKKSHGAKNIDPFLREFVRKGYISDEEFNYLKSELEKETKTGREESIDDIKLRAEFISIYNVKGEKALEIAKLVTDENIDRVSSVLPRQFGNELADALISNNPEIFLMKEKDFSRYATKLADLLALTRKYSFVNDFDPMKAPQNFSSLDALKDTRRKLYDMVGTAALNGDTQTENGEREISEIDRIKLQLAREGFEPEMTFAILQRGFYFNGEYFTGSHKLSEESLERNTRRRYEDFDRRIFNREVSRLITAGAISYIKGYSINPETKSIESGALRNAIRYILIPNIQEE